MERFDIVEQARSLLDTPFKHQGRVAGVGVDCAGLIVCTFKKLGIPYNDFCGYPRTPYAGMLKKSLDEQPAIKQVFDYQAGDILLIKIVKDPQHLAIFAGETIIHSYLTVGKVVEHGFSENWKRRVIAIYRVCE